MKSLTTLFFLASLCLMPLGSLQAQMVVSDPTNLVQNTASAISEVTSTVKAIQAVKMQIDSVKREVKNMQRLDPKGLRRLEAALDAADQVMQRSERTSRDWQTLSNEFDKVYGAYAPPHYKGAAYAKLRRQWRKNSQKAQKQLLDSRAKVKSIHARLAKESRSLEEESKNVEGALAAAQLTTKTLSVMMRQQQLMHQQVLQERQAQHVMQLEAKRRARAAKKRQQDALGGGMGDYKTRAKAVKLPEVKDR